jgi:hypothetical protein
LREAGGGRNDGVLLAANDIFGRVELRLQADVSMARAVLGTDEVGTR